MKNITAKPPALAELAPDEPALSPLAQTSAPRPLTHHALRLAIEHGVTGVLGHAADLQEAAPQVVRVVCEAMAWTCGAAWVQEGGAGGLVRVGAWGEDGLAVAAFLTALPALPTAHVNQGLVRRVWSSGEPVWIEDVQQDPTFLRATQATDAGLRSAFAFPITAGKDIVGVVEIFGRKVLPLDTEWLECTRYIGSQMGQFFLRAQAQSALRESEKRYAETIELAAIGIAHVNDAGRYVHVNRRMCELLGYSRDELLRMTVKQISHPDDRNLTDLDRAKLRSGEIESFEMEKRYLRKDGSAVWMHLTISVRRDTAGRPLDDICIAQDISGRKQAELALQHSEQRFRILVELSSDWYWEIDAELRFTEFDGRNMGGKYRQVLRGRLAWEVPGSDSQAGWADLRARLERREPFRDFEYAYSSQQGRQRFVSVSGEPLFDPEGAFVGYRGVSSDITPRKQAEERIQYLATHDSLTGLANRATFSELLNHAIDMAKRKQRRFAVLFIDLDRFKFINDSLGHEAGDTLLIEVARRLKAGLRSSDIVARLGGDEFVMLLQDLNGNEEAGVIARKLLSAVMMPVSISGQECRVTASIGISTFPDDSLDEAALMTHADVAMYKAKEEGKNNFQFYDSGLEKLSHQRLTLETALRYAIEHDEFSVHYQAKLDLASKRISGVEALLRWTSAAFGSVSPAMFIPLAEETGLILPIGRWVLRAACHQAMQWQRAGLPPVRVSVNLSPRQLSDPDLVPDVRAALADSGLAPDLLELEVTESAVMHNVERAHVILVALKAMGIQLALDDFGTGYSSLAQLKRFPIDTLKVDRSFIRDLPSDSEDRAIAEAIISIGKTLSLTVVAEGVETQAQQDFLSHLACDQMQGYFFSKPVSADAFAELLRTHKS